MIADALGRASELMRRDVDERPTWRELVSHTLEMKNVFTDVEGAKEALITIREAAGPGAASA
jgi:hypothetical protein